LTFQLLSHILHPHPDVEVVKFDGPLLGAMGISPWLSSKLNTRSYTENKYVDAMTPSIIAKASHEHLDGTNKVPKEQQGKGWAMSFDVDASWLDDLSKVTKSLYVVVGRHEVLRDESILLTEQIRKRNPDVDVTLEVIEHAPHDSLLLKCYSKVAGDGTQRMRKWVSRYLPPSIHDCC
jgi:acetyl esterase/lipase